MNSSTGTSKGKRRVHHKYFAVFALFFPGLVMKNGGSIDKLHKICSTFLAIENSHLVGYNQESEKNYNDDVKFVHITSLSHGNSGASNSVSR